jgi:hypothetical protein
MGLNLKRLGLGGLVTLGTEGLGMGDGIRRRVTVACRSLIRTIASVSSRLTHHVTVGVSFRLLLFRARIGLYCP